MNDELENVLRGFSRPTTSTEAGRMPTSSCASRKAAASGVSPGSSRPPGNETSPVCDRRFDERRVSTTLVSPSSSNSGTSTAASRPDRSSSGKTNSGSRGSLPTTAARTRSSDNPRRWSDGSSSHGAGPPGRAPAGRRMRWFPGIPRTRAGSAFGRRGGRGGQLLEQLPQAVGLQVADDPARHGVAPLPLYPVGEQLLRIRRRAVGHVGDTRTVAGYSGTPLVQKIGIKEG